MTCWFFMSYARADDQHGDEELIREFYNDLKSAVSIRIQDQSPPIAFLDQANLQPGDAWPDEIADALCSCKSFLAIMTARYFTRDYCGKEWTIFDNRRKGLGGPKPPSLIIPILWVPPVEGRLPEYATDLQVTFDPAIVQEMERRNLSDYAQYGLYHVAKRKKTTHLNTYDMIVRELATRIIRVAQAHPLQPLARAALPSLKTAINRFAAVQKAQTVMAAAHLETKSRVSSDVQSRAEGAERSAAVVKISRGKMPGLSGREEGFAPAGPKYFRDLFGDLPSEGPEMIWLPGGTFWMGSLHDVSHHWARPVHEVTLSPYAIGRYPVTVGEFRRFVEATSYRTEAEREGKGKGALVWNERHDTEQKSDANWRNPYLDQDERHPVVCISWNDAKAYCDWISKQTGQVYGIPTEAQWEYACRAGRETAYHFGDSKLDLDDYAWFLSNSGGGTRPVGQKPGNPWQLHDMHGNCWEHCQDWYGRYSADADKDPKGPESGSDRVVRGGSWHSFARNCQSASRINWHPSRRIHGLGFRLARTGLLRSNPSAVSGSS